MLIKTDIKSISCWKLKQNFNTDILSCEIINSLRREVGRNLLSARFDFPTDLPQFFPYLTKRQGESRAEYLPDNEYVFVICKECLRLLVLQSFLCQTQQKLINILAYVTRYSYNNGLRSYYWISCHFIFHKYSIV